MKIGIIGTGEMGSVLALKFARCGHAVSIANSRGPASIKQHAEQIGVKPVTVEDAIKNQEVIIVSIPLKNVPDLPTQMFKQLAKHVVVIDTMNYYPNLRDNAIPALEQTGIDSLWVQQQLGFPVTKVFNSILATSLEDKGKMKGENNRIALAVSGNDMNAKKIVFTLVEESGFDAFDIGAISQSWMQQPGSPIYCRNIDIETLKNRVDAMKAAGQSMHYNIIAKRKTDEGLMKADYPAYLKSLQE